MGCKSLKNKIKLNKLTLRWMKHMATSTVEQTKLWKIFRERSFAAKREDDIATVRNECNSVEDFLTEFFKTFPTYTLHDATHCKNVCDIMAELLGENGLSKLTTLEVAFLILSAYFHDTGMVYTVEEKNAHLSNQDFQIFRKKNPQVDKVIIENNGSIPDNIAEWYLRRIHTQRMKRVDVLVIENVSIKDKLTAICESHGNNVNDILTNDVLNNFDKNRADLVFCAVLLRLADILDFDKTRAPIVLYDYLDLEDANNSHLVKSKNEFLKHIDSLGFDFRSSRNGMWELPFSATCRNIEIEHDIREFLNIIDMELENCKRLLANRNGRWAKFPLPVSIKREESYGLNYQYGEYLFTLDKERILELLIGDNLYINNTVFVRELTQNAIDTTRFRKIVSNFNREDDYQPRIDITTWVDNENYQWFRIEDNGMGMDEQQIREYFLKVGKSYYASYEFENDLRKYLIDGKNFRPISRFGIGVLSCFLSGDKVEVSTYSATGSPIRLSISANANYFTLQLKEKHHDAKVMPTPPGKKSVGYLNSYGTCIAVRLDPTKHSYEFNFKEMINEYIMFPPVPIYFNDDINISTEADFLYDISTSEIIKIEIPQNIIEKLCDQEGIEIEPESHVKIRLVNLENYITEVNKPYMKGAMFFIEDCLVYKESLYRNKEFGLNKHNKIVKCELFVKKILQKHCLMLGVARYKKDNSGMSIIDDSSMFPNLMNNGYENSSNPPQLLEENKNCENVTFNQSFSGSFEKTHAEMYDLNVDLNDISWYSKYISQELNIKSLNFGLFNLFNDEYGECFDYSSTLTHNGVIFYKTNKPFQDFSHVSLKIIFSDMFYPNLNLSRDAIISMPLEMISEINLSLRKIHEAIQPGTVNGKKLDFNNNHNFYNDLCRIPTKTSAQKINELNNVKDLNGWYDYFSRHGLMKKYSFHLPRREMMLNPKCDKLAHMIYSTLFQNTYDIGYNTRTDVDGEIIIIEGEAELNYDINKYYPPLFFIKAMNDDRFFVCPKNELYYGDYFDYSFLNLNHPDSVWLVSRTKSLYNKYPALFSELVYTVLDGDIGKFEVLWSKVKILVSVKTTASTASKESKVNYLQILIFGGIR